MNKPPSAYEKYLGMQILAKSDGSSRVSMSFREELSNPMGIFHGGALASIADTAAVQAIHSLVPTGPYYTVELKMKYINPAKPGEIFAEAKTKHLKSKIFRSEVQILDAQGDLVAKAVIKNYLPNWKNEGME